MITKRKYNPFLLNLRLFHIKKTKRRIPMKDSSFRNSIIIIV